MSTSPHRKRIKHFEDRGHAHFLTFSCYHRRPLLGNPIWNRLLSQAIDAALGRYGFDLWGFVFMPEHVHLLVYPTQPAYEMKRLLFAVKRPFSYRIKQDLLLTNPEMMRELTIRERPGKESSRFWQEGPGYDRNVQSPAGAVEYLEYMHNNPVKRRLCQLPQDWKWSSYRYYCESGFFDPELPRVTLFTGI